LGVRLAVDDFGTGYSSLSHLARFPFDVLKVDQRFAKNIFTDPKDQVIVSGIMAIARNLNIEVIAEGIEIPEQLLFFESMGCTFVQGYYFSRPVSAPKLEEILKWGKYPYS
jgi:EAL domain-containing protein (putative c-di-GMP-specific phosphodiesterase class I)